MDTDKTFYEILEVDETASTDTIKKQYHRLVRQYHPDIAKNLHEANELFIALNEAYRTLKDASLREAYDFGLNEAREYAKQPHPKEEEMPAEEEFVIETPEERRKKELLFSELIESARGLMKQSKPNEADAILDKALEIRQNSPELWELNGDIHRSMRSFDIAMTSYSKAAQLTGNNSHIREKLMDTLAERSGKPRKATSTSTSAKKKGGFFGKMFK
ncbi:MAG: DnaJ domain-containing protein [Abditibacteriota bacterium]|nr:DnaJ domain-containing protein [Abditibacteriota bacterium]